MGKTDSTRTAPDDAEEVGARAAGYRRVAGVDEAGRGPLAGPVVVAAVVFAEGRFPAGLDDSKKLSAQRREALFVDILAMGEVAIVVAPPSEIDRLNIRGATLACMRQALLALPSPVDFALIDGRDLPDALPCPAKALVGGDGRSVSIAAASIVAKVTRDAMCPVMDMDAAGYGFSGHKGYGTRAHMLALSSIGVTPHHRRTFAPVALAIG
ncbi:MAG: ribonuclease HII [Alphaproteobacteria bacterium]|nr:ribonuclease HII [Alphaproteobacteria bacterium]